MEEIKQNTIIKWDSNTIFDVKYNNNEIQIRGDGYINATQMCKMSNKKLYAFKRLPETLKFVEILGRDYNALELYQK